MKYAIAYWFISEKNNLQITTVEADDPITAIVEGARQLMNSDPDTDEWLNGFLKPVSLAWYATRIKEIQEKFFNTGQIIAVMPIKEEMIEIATPEEFDRAPVVTVECPLCGAISNHHKWPRKKLVVICDACNYEWVAVDADGRIYKPKLK